MHTFTLTVLITKSILFSTLGENWLESLHSFVKILTADTKKKP